MIRALLTTLVFCGVVSCGGDDDVTVDMKCGAITCSAGMVPDFTSCSCESAVDASVPQDLADRG